MRTVETNKNLYELMPYLLCDADVFPGWERLFLQMCEDIRQPLIDAGQLNEFQFMQVKEKYGTLRVYHNGAPKEVQDIINKYEYMSQFVCQKCGRPATKETQGWIASFCDECYPDDDILESIKFEPIMHIFGYKNGERYERTLDCSDEWRRLYYGS